ncbi:RNA polymerase subunit sigma [Streptomyces chrestomyceticus JCM 4735]|uniref:RNA polymerase subunit sigma n=1 Tax=Streptomyces chrestomyceticus JCM 4735 TaxID=1306181 RepID=A0A7U9KXQ8_9ACTN|nr:zf-HC2 domain-containing protein [Streptomyces chrestomyceticus]GCD37335.1 RNA polymerase subunit sigma [Streptomyces chrestomyceticus JCM 4735]
MKRPVEPVAHTDVGAYALGVLDAAEAARFEEHLTDCDRCAAELDGLLGLPPLLADARESAPDPEAVTPAPGPGLLAGLLEEVGAVRRTRRRRRLYLVAAAAVLVVGGPLATYALTAGDDAESPEHLTSYARAMYEHGEKAGTVDPVTKVAASVSMERRPWGTHVALKLGNVRGPLTCDLVAVGKSGAEQTVTTWAVPPGGYGLKDGAAKWNKEPLYTHGGSAMNRSYIDHFEVRTLDGRRLAEIKV